MVLRKNCLFKKNGIMKLMYSFFYFILAFVLFCGIQKEVKAQNLNIDIQISLVDGGTYKHDIVGEGLSNKSQFTWDISLYDKSDPSRLICTKTPADYTTENWSFVPGSYVSVAFDLDLFATCGGWVVGQKVVLNLKVTDTASPWYGAKASCTFNIPANSTMLMNMVDPPQGILLEKEVPVPTISVTGATLCQGEAGKTVTATVKDAPTGFSIDWDNPNITTGSSATIGAIGTGLAAGTHNLEAKLKDASGNVIKDKSGNEIKANYTVKVNPLPTVSITPTELCKGGKITASGGDSYKWTKGATGSSAQVTPNASGEYVVEVTKSGCKKEEKVNITVNEVPSVTIGTPAKTNVCVGEVIRVTATASGGSGSGYKYNWTNASGDAAGTKTAVAGDNKIKLTVTDGKNCTSAFSNEVNVVGHEVKVAVSDITPCVGDIGSLTARPTFNPNGQQRDVTYTWSPATDIVSGQGNASIQVKAYDAPGVHEFTVEVKNGHGCGATAKGKVTTKECTQPPSLAVTPPVTTPTGLKGDPIPACVTASGGQCGGQYTFAWSSQDAGVTVTPTTPGCANVTSTTSGTKNVCVEVTCGNEKKKECFDVKVTEGNVNLRLEWTITDMVCQYPGETRTISITAVGGPAGTKYSFVLSTPDGSAALTVNGDTKTTWTHIVTADKKGIYDISNLSALLPDGTTSPVTISPGAKINADFYKVPAVYANGVVANSTLEHCEGEELILTGSGDAIRYTWNNGVQNGQPFVPTVAGVYEVTGVTENNCSATDQVTVNLNPKPQLDITVSGNEICPGEEVTLGATANLGTVTWNNGVINGAPIKIDVSGEHKFTATATDPATGCSMSKDTTIIVKAKPTIVSHSKNPRNIAIGKDVYFAVKATGDEPLTYEWYRKENGIWSLLTDNSVSLPTISGAITDSLVLQTVPESWDGSELKVVVKNDCDTTSMVFQLGVKECFEIEIELLMQEGIIPDTDPTNKIDGWYCRNRRIALRAVLSSPEGYDIENGHYKWTIDGLELPEEHFELETDTCVLTWIPEFQEDDIVVKVCGYCDGACEEVCVQYIRLKAREFEKVSVDLLTSVDPDHRFCPGDTVDFWVTAKNVGDSARYEWHNDIFHLPNGNPNNELLNYSDTELTMVMGQEDTWMKVIVTPSNEVCTEDSVYIDEIFLRKGQWVTPSLRIINNIEDTMACSGDRILFTAVYENAGTNPTFHWRKDVWDWGHEQFAEAVLEDKDMWLKCWLVPGNDVCYDGSLLVDSMIIRVLENPTVVISADLTNKAPGDEIVIESEVTNMPSKAHYTWYLNYDYTLSNSDYPEYISDKLAQGDVIQCGVTGERICTSEVMSNELVIYFGDQSRDTMITIYQGEKIRNLNMRRKGDTGNSIFRITADGYPRWGVGSMNFNGHFDYTPNAGFVGSDVVKYEVVDKFDQTKVETGYIYISVMDRKRFFIPNIITPNGDGINDTWNLEFLADYPDHHITIYNRDGVVVFEATNYQNDWDGTGMTTSGYISHFNLANGVYTYVIDLGNKEILKNWIEIRRDMNRGKYKY